MHLSKPTELLYQQSETYCLNQQSPRYERNPKMECTQCQIKLTVLTTEDITSLKVQTKRKLILSWKDWLKTKTTVHRKQHTIVGKFASH